MIVADLTGKNANVFYEIGMAHTVGKRSVLISRDIDELPFDLKHLRVIHYANTPVGLAALYSELQESIRFAVEASSSLGELHRENKQRMKARNLRSSGELLD